MLRPYQHNLKRDIYRAWADGHRNVLAVLPTGGGKTVIFSTILAEHNCTSLAMAHRQELVSQMSLTLARNNVRHRVIGTPSLARICAALHVNELGRSFTNPHARCAVASVDTLIRRDPNDPFFKEVQLVIVDESAHLVKNKWGDAVAMFPNAKLLGLTATPCRADGQGLGKHADGVMDVMIQGPTLRQLINDGWLTEYRIFAPKSDVDLSHVTISANGDYSPPKLAEAIHKSHLVGDVVSHYKTICPDKLCAVFCVDVEAAKETCMAFMNAGVRAACITGNTPDMLRQHTLREFRAGNIKVLTSIDVFVEGFDLPALEAIIMARPTSSFGLYAQMIGRVLRLMEGKTHAIIIDAVSNVLRHGLPDAPRQWSLDRRERKTRSTPDDAVPIKTCTKCLAVYERIYAACPYCGTIPTPASRSAIDAVDGSLAEMSPDLLARLRGEIDKPLTIPYNATPEIIGACKKRHRERAEAQQMLRDLMALWGGWRTAEGDTIDMQQRRFYLTYGIDVLSAQALNRADSEVLGDRVRQVLIDASVNIEYNPPL